MGLNKEEEEILKQIELGLTEEDPELEKTAESLTLSNFSRSRSLISFITFVIGFFMMFFREETIQGTESLPRSVLIIFWFISNVIIISSRFILKGLLYSWENLVTDRRKTIIYGAGNAGVQILDSLKKSNEYLPIAFIDDDEKKQGTIINSIEVFPLNMIDELVKQKNVKELFFAIPSVNQSVRKEILKRLTRYPIEVKLLPRIDDLENGSISLEQIKDVDVSLIIAVILQKIAANTTLETLKLNGIEPAYIEPLTTYSYLLPSRLEIKCDDEALNELIEALKWRNEYVAEFNLNTAEPWTAIFNHRYLNIQEDKPNRIELDLPSKNYVILKHFFETQMRLL